MASEKASCPASRSEVIRLYFLDHRAKLIDIAAFLDRLDRAPDDLPDGVDFRLEAFRAALHILLEDQPHRARRVLELFSDHTAEPIESAAGLKGASGACPPAPGVGAEGS
ncbi:MAG: hypothetical protein ACYTGG_09570 [Planctomycetota bacterium]|jgi:hypothetical protein